MATETATLLITCKDQPGLVAAVSEFLLRHGGNILHADQHTDADEGLFLQRVEWDLDGFALLRSDIGAAFAPVADRFGMTWELRFSDAVPRIAMFVSRQPHCMYDLLARWQTSELKCDIPLIISNHPDLAPIARRFDVDYHCLPVSPETKLAQEARALELCAAKQIDLIVLARYMQILSPDFVRRYPQRILNIHHSFLPAFPGGRPYHRAHERGVKIIGATAHYVTPDLDEGPIIEQDVVRVSHRDEVADLIAKGRDLERVVLARAVALHLRGGVLVYAGKTVVFD
jgi:formyltetrahydrofolate deformylase